VYYIIPGKLRIDNFPDYTDLATGVDKYMRGSVAWIVKEITVGSAECPGVAERTLEFSAVNHGG
jgi:hypothetical protein